MTREEKIAQLVLRKNNLQPPYDLIALVKTKANLSFKPFPFKADGITVDIKSKKPQIFINSLVTSQARRNFTIAHELGHVFLPWHKGTIVSEVNYSPHEHYAYREMEAEANRFASELLMPSEWVKNILIGNEHFQRKLIKIIHDAKVSLEAALIKIENLCEERRYILQFDSNFNCIKEITGINVRRLGFEYKGFDKKELTDYEEYEDFCLNGSRIITFLLKHNNPDEFDKVDARLWREVLDQILSDCNAQDKKLSVNAIVPTRVSQCKKEGIVDIKHICAEVKLHFNGRKGLDVVIKHELFPVYIRKRVDDLMSRR